MELINFRLRGRFAHFLRAEASASALSYPLPPRTVLLGLMGAVLGLSKDTPQVVLEPANIAVSGKFPKTYWHGTKLRQTLPAPMPLVIKKTHKGTSSEQKMPHIVLQEWLLNPEYTIWVSIPEPYHTELKKRLKDRQWYFSPFLGLSEMMADIEYMGASEGSSLPDGLYDVQTVFQQDSADIDLEAVIERRLSIHILQMPRTVTQYRVFSHSSYVAERNARPIPLKTRRAYKTDNEVLMFL